MDALNGVVSEVAIDAVKPNTDIVVTDRDRLEILSSVKVPKSVTPLGGKLYFVDIGGKALHEYDPATATDRVMARPGAGKAEFTTALGANEDGSLMVATESGVYYVKPGAGEGVQQNQVRCRGEDYQKEFPNDAWQLAAKLEMGENERPNNGVMIPCSDGKTRFFLGTCAVDPDLAEKHASQGRRLPGRLMVLEEKNGQMETRELMGSLMTVNALSGQDISINPPDAAPDDQLPPNIVLTYADSWKDASVLKTGHYSPTLGKIMETDILVDFKHKNPGNPEELAIANNGRPDGTSPVLYRGQPAVAVAAIDVNEIRIYPVGQGEQEANQPMAKILLPEHIKKPTMVTFAEEDGKTVAYVTAFEITRQGNAGKIYRLAGDEVQVFKPINHVGSYAGLDAARSAEQFVSAAASVMERSA